jgi:hypothetical protein
MSSNLANLCSSEASVWSPLESCDSLFFVFTERPKERRGAEAVGANSCLCEKA